MGFGLLIIGYISVLGVLPYLYLYLSWSVFIAVAGGGFMLAGFCKLQGYNIYFKAMKYICIVYILVLLGGAPFYIFFADITYLPVFMLVSKIIRSCVMFVFHFFLITGISSLAKEIENTIVETKAKRGMVITYVFFSAFVLEFFNMAEFAAVLLVFTLLYFILTLSLLFSCYMRITYEGRDEEIDEKFKNNKKR